MEGLESVFCVCEFRTLCAAVACSGTFALVTILLLR
ncbi:hypothetical protein EDF56_10959 [Novosphingobium sp. PhB165]|nr:hypothetical protein EDF56_10959 [Novosphingobium sp. PhB165]